MARSRNKRKRAAKSAATKPPPPPVPPQTNWHRIGRLVSTVFGGGVVFLVFESAGAAGIVDMTLAYLMLVAAWVVGLITIVIAVRSWPVPRHHRLLSGALSGVVLTAMLLGVGWYEKTHQSTAEAESRLRIDKFIPVPPTDRTPFYLNVQFTNEGSLPTTQVRRADIAINSANEAGPLREDDLERTIEEIYEDYLPKQPVSESEIQPKDTQFYTVMQPSSPASPSVKEWKEVLARKRSIYIIGAIQYKDKNTSDGKWRNTQYCVVLFGGTIGMCEKYNRIFTDG